MNIDYSLNPESEGKSTYSCTSILYISLCSMINIQILNCQRCINEVVIILPRTYEADYMLYTKRLQITLTYHKLGTIKMF
jgi:hypothetical protein